MFVRLAITLGVVAGLTLNSGATVAGPIPYAWGEECATMSSMHGDPCFQSLFSQAVHADDTGVAMDLLAQLMHRGALDDCHMLAHMLGQEAMRGSPSLQAAFLGGDLRCAAGYFHGAASDYIETGGDIGTACAPIQDLRLHRECIHGVGHGILRAEPGRDAALAACDTFLADSDAGECRAGVLMENAMRLVELVGPAFGEAFAHACDGLEPGGEAASVCGENLGEAAMFRHRHLVHDALGDCALVPAELGPQCVHGVADEESLVAWERAHPDEWL